MIYDETERGDAGAPQTGVREQRFYAVVDGERIPGLLWTPRMPVPGAPLILLGHGRRIDKRNRWFVDLGQRFAARGWNSVAIDAPGHGERRARTTADWPRPGFDESIAGWHAALELVSSDFGLKTDALGYWGLSMGAALGIPLVARDVRFRAAVLGLMHADWPPSGGSRLREDAAALGLPVLFFVNWDDTRVPRQRAFELFELAGSTDKRMVAYPGDHGRLPRVSFDEAEAFLARYL